MDILGIPIAIGSACALAKAIKIGIVLKKETTFRLGKIERPNREVLTPLNLDVIKGLDEEYKLRTDINKLDEILDRRNKTYLRKNIRNLKLGNLSKYEFKDPNGAYNPASNKIELGQIEDRSELDHELLRIASTTKVFGHVFSGFSQSTFFSNVGKGLNTGYTQVLNSRYFDHKPNNEFYPERLFARCIEKMVGKDNMENYYFMGELSFLIEDLEPYMKENDVEALIISLDIINKYGHKEKKSKRQEELVKKAYIKATLATRKGLLLLVQKSGYDPSMIDMYYKCTNMINELLNENGITEEDLSIDDVVKLEPINLMEIARKRKVRIEK